MDAQTLATAMGCSRAVADRYIGDFNVALRQAGCTTVNRAAMYCAQIGHESVGLRYMEEIASGAAYEGRKDLGNIHPGDGKRFKGRGPIQLTGRHNYGRFGVWCRATGLVSDANTFVNNPAAVATSKWGFLAASWYWTVARPALNGQADRRELEAATRSINGGLNGLTDRRARWNRCLQLGAALLPSGGGSTPAPHRPGGIESMAFNDGFDDWAGNKQTVQSWMNNVDRRVAETAAQVKAIQSKVDWMASTLGNTPDLNRDGRKGDVSLVDFRQFQVDTLAAIRDAVNELKAATK
ncbi:hypothetical protein CFN78_06735 [Amycolatopsis antarctica]|uniref:Glycoside hydrolase family 19 catalytic domain-containing protein n=1 Tax=Amycolatopsis antarctica TaxID=1854586 RepID=A0A263D7I3_9PSEU|nr:glycoside hydrolase family 19 protein [Amycolatopsis antarctica]OZM73978.1 hypothetical protein CFN78_06735 [Amycolatopsis antarctica]